jgi:hypothetical protein
MSMNFVMEWVGGWVGGDVRYVGWMEVKIGFEWKTAAISKSNSWWSVEEWVFVLCWDGLVGLKVR